MAIGISILVTFILIIVNGFFSASEMALVNMRRSRLQSDADDGDTRARRALNVAEDTDDLLATIQVAITLVGFFASAAAATTLSEPFSGWLQTLGMPAGVASPLATILITLVVSYFSIVVGELLPKRMALSDAEGMGKSVAGPIAVFRTLTRPLVWLTSKSCDGLARLLHVKSADDRQSVTEDEIRVIVSDNDELQDDEKRMIHEIIDLGDTVAREVMTPRADIIFVEDVESVETALDRMRGTGFSRLPVFHEDYDRIVGQVMYKDLVPALMDGKGEAPVGDFAQEAYFVPDSKDVFPMLREMQTNRLQMAIVVDEYGGTDGLITVEDIVEEIVGEIADESDRDSNKYITCLADGEWMVEGSCPVEDAADAGWPVRESDDYETIAGWLIDTVDSIPETGDEYTIDGYLFKVQTMRRNRISVMRVRRLEAEEDDGCEGNTQRTSNGDVTPS